MFLKFLCKNRKEVPIFYQNQKNFSQISNHINFLDLEAPLQKTCHHCIKTKSRVRAFTDRVSAAEYFQTRIAS